MRDDSLPPAIEAALPGPAFDQPRPRPAQLAAAVRGFLHDRRFLVRTPATAG
jgi:hypothetical protein